MANLSTRTKGLTRVLLDRMVEDGEYSGLLFLFRPGRGMDYVIENLTRELSEEVEVDNGSTLW